VITAILLLVLFYVYRKLGYSFVSFFAFAVGVLGISISLFLYDSFSEFWDDMGPELIGLTFDIGLLYIFLEFFRRRDEQRKEKEVLREHLRIQMAKFLNFASASYVYVLTGKYDKDANPDTVEETMMYYIKEFDFDIEKFKGHPTTVSVNDLYLYDSFNTTVNIRNLNEYEAVTSEYDTYFRVPVQKQIEKIITIYQPVIPTDLYGDLLKFYREISFSMIWLADLEDTSEYIIDSLKDIGKLILDLDKKYNFQVEIRGYPRQTSTFDRLSQKIKTTFESIFRRPKTK
jgi:hypothetical protein